MTQWVLSGKRSSSLTVLDLDTSINVTKDYRCFFGGKAHQTFWLTVLAGKHFLIIITLTETRNVYRERAGVQEPMASCWITALKKMPGHHTLAEAREPLVRGISFQERESGRGQGIHILSFLQDSVNIWDKKNRRNVTTLYYLHLLFLEVSNTTTHILLDCLCMISENREGIY